MTIHDAFDCVPVCRYVRGRCVYDGDIDAVCGLETCGWVSCWGVCPRYKPEQDGGFEKNDPLTLEELRERTKPVWCAVPDCSWIPEGGYYCLCEKGMITAPSKQTFRAEECLKNGWVLLDRPPGQ